MRKLIIILLIVFLWIPIGHVKMPLKDRKIEKHLRVSVTMYTIDEKQTDSTPLMTASGFKLDSVRPKKHRIIAVSRDLKKKLKFGQKVRVEGIGKWDGVYRVEDLMHSRWKNKIDILVNPGDRAVSFRKARLYLVE